MATSAYTHKHRQERREGRQVSLTKLALVAANFALWVGIIGAVTLIAR